MSENKQTTETETSEPIKEPNDIHEAIIEVYRKVGYVQKSGKIEIGKGSYKFAGEAEFIAAIRPAMLSVGIYQQPLSVQVISNDRIETEKVWDGKATKTYQFRTVFLSVYRFTHAPSKTYVDVPAIGEGMDSGDKSSYKSMTGADKYALRQLFMIETGDDPDKYASEEHGGVSDKPSDKKVSGKQIYGTFKAMKDRCAAIEEAVKSAKTFEELKAVGEDNKAHIDAIKATEGGDMWYDKMKKLISEQKLIIQEQNAMDAAFKGAL